MSCPSLNPNSFLKFIYFNWRMIALQYWLGFCHISTWISHRYTYVPSLLNLPPTPTPSHSSRLSQSTSLSSLSHTANSHWLSTLQRVVYMLPHCSLSVPPSPSTHLPTCVHKSVLYVCVSIAALQIGSSVLSFQIPYISINIWYLFFSFWLTSLCIIGSRFNHLIRTDSNVFLYMAE